MTADPLRAVREAVQPLEPGGQAHRAEARGRAYSVPGLPYRAPEGSQEGSPASSFPSPFPHPAGPQGDRFAACRSWAGRRTAALSGAAALYSQPPAVAVLWARHREAADQWNAALGRAARLSWGAGHTAVYATVHGVLAVTHSPAGFAVLAVLVAAAFLWL